MHHAIMPLPSFAEFESSMRSAGYEQVLERPWAANTVVPPHRHPFVADALVVRGEMWLAVDGDPEQHLRAGDRFHLARDVEHSERYGAEGATYWVARKE